MSFTRFLPPVWRKKLQESHDMYSMHDAVIGAIDYTLSQVKDDTIMSKQESLINEAEGPFLDYWGSWFGLNRQDGWSDDVYREHIKSHVTHPRSTIEGIRQAIVNYFDLNMSDVYIYEPFRDIFRWNRGKWNSSYKFHSTYYDTAVIDIQLGVAVPSSIQDLLNWFRMAGVLWVVSYNGSAYNPDAPIFDFSSDDTLMFINDLSLLYGYSVYNAFSVSPGIYSSNPEPFSEFIWNKSAWNSGDKWLGQEPEVTPYVELSQSALDYSPSNLYSGDTQLFFGSELSDTDYNALIANDTKYVPFSSNYKDTDSNMLVSSANLSGFTASLAIKESFGNYNMYHVTSSVTISSNQTPTLAPGDYYIGCYAKLDSTASVQIKYDKNEDPVLLSSSYNGNYMWNTIKITVDDTFELPDEGIQFIVNGPFKDDDNYIGLFYLGQAQQYTDSSLSDNFVYTSFNLAGFYNQYVGELSTSSYGSELNSLYSNKILGYAFKQLSTSTDSSGPINVQLYNWSINLWVTIGTLDGTFYSYSMNDISPYVNASGYVYSRLDLTGAVDILLNLNWTGLNISSKSLGYGVNLYSDNNLYGVDIDITTAGYLQLLYGYNIYNKDEIVPGSSIEAPSEYSVLSWNNNSWNDGSSWEGNYDSGLPFIESSASSLDYTPRGYYGSYKLFMGTPTSQDDLSKLGNQTGTVSYSSSTSEDQGNLLYAPFSSLEGSNGYPGVLVSDDNKDSLEIKLTPSNILSTGNYNIGIYACLPTGSSVSVQYADGRDAVLISSQYNGEYKWNYVTVPYASTDTSSAVTYIISLPKGSSGYVQYVSLNANTSKLTSGGTNNYVYQTYDLANYYLNKYKDIPNVSYANLFSSLYNSTMVGMDYTSVAGDYTFEVYNFTSNHWDSISTLSGTSFSWRLNNYQDYLSKYGVLYTRLHATEDSSVTLSWLSLSLANETEGYGTTLYSDNSNYGVDLVTELAKYLITQFGINNYTRTEITQGASEQGTPFEWNEGAWNSNDTYSGKYPYGNQYYSMTESNTDFNPVGYKGLIPVGSPLDTSNLGISSVTVSSDYKDNTNNQLSEIIPNTVRDKEVVEIPIGTPLVSGDYYFGLYSNLPDNSTVSVQYAEDVEPQVVVPLASSGYNWQTVKITIDASKQLLDTFNVIYSIPAGSQGTAGYYYLGTTNQRYSSNSETNKTVYDYGTINVVQSYLDQGNILDSSNYQKELSSKVNSSSLIISNGTSSSSIQLYNQVSNTWDTVSDLSKAESDIDLGNLSLYLNPDGVVYYRIIVLDILEINDLYLILDIQGTEVGTKLYSTNYNFGLSITAE